MGSRIIPRVVRGRLFFDVGHVLLASLAAAAAASAWSTADADRLDIVGGGL